jgi:isoquinoline 1-oxidoreductase beta subunit
MKDAPDIEVALLQSGETPHGVGEPPIGPIAAAVANAVFALSGQRLRQLPLKLV